MIGEFAKKCVAKEKSANAHYFASKECLHSKVSPNKDDDFSMKFIVSACLFQMLEKKIFSLKPIVGWGIIALEFIDAYQKNLNLRT